MRVLGVILVLLTVASLPQPAGAQEQQHYLTGFPTLKQQHGLTCEAAAASMGTRALVSEAQIMAEIPSNPDPFLGFRGDPNGSSGGLKNYGVYPPPVAHALAHYDYASKVLYHIKDRKLRAYVDRGWPIVVWITYGLRRERPELAGAGTDRLVLVPYEHAILVTGYNRASVTGNDPWTGNVVHYKWANFNRSWGYFGNMALAIDPCARPTPIAAIHFDAAAASAAGATWSWDPAAHDTAYHVRVVEGWGANAVVYDSVQTATALTLTDLLPGRTYQVTVWGESACGDKSAPFTLLTRIPGLPAIPTPGSIVPTSTPVPTGTPTP